MAGSSVMTNQRAFENLFVVVREFRDGGKLLFDVLKKARNSRWKMGMAIALSTDSVLTWWKERCVRVSI
jgi:hypothetical protein